MVSCSILIFKIGCRIKKCLLLAAGLRVGNYTFQFWGQLF